MPMQRWKYLTVAVDHDSNDVLNKLGAEGWEMTGIVGQIGYFDGHPRGLWGWAFFKRPADSVADDLRALSLLEE